MRLPPKEDHMWRRGVALALVLLAAVVTGCSEETEDDARETATSLEQEAREAAGDLRKAAGDAWASLRTDSERIVDQIQTRNDPNAKQQLLDKCRDSLEKLRRANSNSAERVDQLCSRIRNTDVNAREAWNDVKREINEIVID
jgi:hypothetical protein